MNKKPRKGKGKGQKLLVSGDTIIQVYRKKGDASGSVSGSNLNESGFLDQSQNDSFVLQESEETPRDDASKNGESASIVSINQSQHSEKDEEEKAASKDGATGQSTNIEGADPDTEFFSPDKYDKMLESLKSEDKEVGAPAKDEEFIHEQASAEEAKIQTDAIQ